MQYIILESTERTSIEDVDTFKSSLSYYKEQGFSVAMDDVGSGYSGINRLFIINPHFIKTGEPAFREQIAAPVFALTCDNRGAKKLP